MSNTQKKQEEGKFAINPVAAGVAGAVVGAGIAVAGAVALSNDENRKKVGDTINAVKDKVLNYVEDMQDQAEEKKNEVTKKATKVLKDVKKDLK